MSFAVPQIHSAGATHASASAHAPTQFAGAHTAFGHGQDEVSFAASAKPAAKGATANLGIITGLLACCAIVPFMVGMLAMGGIALAASRAVKGVRHIHLPQVPQIA